MIIIVKKFQRFIASLCIVLFCFTLYSSAFNERNYRVKANPLIAAEIRLIGSALVGAGIFFATREQLADTCNQIYDNLSSDYQIMLHEYAETSNGGRATVPAVLFNSILNNIKSIFGSNPSSNFVKTETALGTAITTNSSYEGLNSPISVINQEVLGSLSDNQTFSCQWGRLTLNYNADGGGYGGDNRGLTITCPDGYKYFIGSDGYYNNGYMFGDSSFIVPIVYSASSSTPDLKFFIHRYGNTMDPDVIGIGNYCRPKVYVNGSWIDFSGNLYNDIATHVTGLKSTSATINTNTYNTVVNNTYTEPVSVSVPKTIDDVYNQTSDEALTLPVSVPNAVSGVKPGIADTIQSWLSGLWDIITDIPAKIKGLWDYLKDVLERIYNGILSIPRSVSDAVGRFFDLTIPINLTPLIVAGTTFSTVFPFSLPWDLYNSFATLNVSSIKPDFNFDLSSLPLASICGFSYLEIDLSLFDGLFVVVRTFELILFDIGLILLTRKLLGGDV